MKCHCLFSINRQESGLKRYFINRKGPFHLTYGFDENLAFVKFYYEGSIRVYSLNSEACFYTHIPILTDRKGLSAFQLNPVTAEGTDFKGIDKVASVGAEKLGKLQAEKRNTAPDQKITGKGIDTAPLICCLDVYDFDGMDAVPVILTVAESQGFPGMLHKIQGFNIIGKIAAGLKGRIIGRKINGIGAVDVEKGQTFLFFPPCIGHTDAGEPNLPVSQQGCGAVTAIDHPKASFVNQDIIFLLRKQDRQFLQFLLGGSLKRLQVIRPLEVTGADPYKFLCHRSGQAVKIPAVKAMDILAGKADNFRFSISFLIHRQAGPFL